VRGRVVVGIAALATLLTACSTQRSAAPLGPPQLLADPAGLRQWTVRPAWTVDVGNPAGVSVAADATDVAGFSAGPGDLPAPWAFTSGGARIPLLQAFGSAVFALPGGMVAVGPGVSDPPMPTRLFTEAGRQIWAGASVGPIAVSTDATGSRIGVVDHGAATATELAVAGGTVTALRAPALAALAAGPRLLFGQGRTALLVDAHGATLLAPDGGTRWHLPVNLAGMRVSARLGASGRGMIASTAGRDAALYRFSAVNGRVRALWQRVLPPGGTDTLAAATGGRVLVLGVGGPGTAALFRTADGARLWQDTLPTVAPAGGPAVTAGAIGPGGDVVLAVERCLPDGGGCLLFLDSSGIPTGALRLSPAAQVALSGTGGAAGVIGDGAWGKGSLAWLDLTPFLPAAPSK
jgi:hypothetical protein